MLDYTDTRQMLMDGHLGMDAVTAEIAMVEFGKWLEQRWEHLKEQDPQGLVALWNELHIE